MKNLIKFLLSFFLLFISVNCFSQSYFLHKIEGDKQLGIRGIELKKDFILKLTDSNDIPVENAEISLHIVENVTDERNSSFLTTPYILFTDENGCVRTKLVLGKSTGNRIIIIANAKDFSPDPVHFTVSVLNKNWFLLMLVGILGGTALLLFGMFKINSAFQKMASQNVRTILTKFTSTRIKGFLTGLIVTGINQSSSATLLLQVTLASAGILTFFQAMSVTIGASVGSTITGQLVAFRLVDYALAITALGYFISFFSSKKNLVNLGDAIFGFGLLFYGMKIMADAMIPITLNNDILMFIASIKSPLISILIGILFTMIIQSSGATVGITIVLASSGILSLLQSICICLGAQIGTSITTALIASINQTRNGKRVVIWHLFYQILGVLLVYPFISFITYNGEPSWNYFVKIFTEKFIFSSDIARQVAMSHTLVTLFTGFIILPFIPLFHKFFIWIYPNLTKENHFGIAFIDEKYIDDPNKALDLSKKEIIRLLAIVSELVDESVKALKTRHEVIGEKIVYKSLQVGELSSQIIPYLTKITKNELNYRQSKKEIALLYIAGDLEQIADIIHRNLMYISRQKIRNHLRFSQEGLEDIKYLHDIVNNNCLKILNYFIDEDTSTIYDIQKLYTKFQLEVHNLKKKHIERLHSDLQESIETSGLHMEVLDQYTRINDILLDIVVTILDEKEGNN